MSFLFARAANHRKGWFAVVLLSVVLSGCGSGESDSASLPNGTIDAAKQDKAKEVVQGFFAAAKDAPSPALAKFIAPSSSLKPSSFSKSSDDYAPFVGASGLIVDSVGSSGAGGKVVVRSHFLGTDGKTYRTNFTLKGKDDLLIDTVLRPSYATAPTAQAAGSSKTP